MAVSVNATFDKFVALCRPDREAVGYDAYYECATNITGDASGGSATVIMTLSGGAARKKRLALLMHTLTAVNAATSWAVQFSYVDERGVSQTIVGSITEVLVAGSIGCPEITAFQRLWEITSRHIIRSIGTVTLTLTALNSVANVGTTYVVARICIVGSDYEYE
ncbi:MAG: hypothetical protein FJ006_12960 [Chloroflexi bacterium]|nr:hypothetical protein [Chloroflexota bacterium]